MYQRRKIDDCRVPFPFRVQHSSNYPTHKLEWVSDSMGRDYPHSYPQLIPTQVEWLSIPEYPLDTPLVSKLPFGGPVPNESTFVSLSDIDPSQVSMLHMGDDVYVMRMSGINTM